MSACIHLYIHIFYMRVYMSDRYHIEKLLPVYLHEYDAYVVLQIMLRPNGSLKITRIGLDYFDICNKANLIGDASQNQILNMLQQSVDKSVDELYIYDEYKSSNSSDYSNYSTSNYSSSIFVDEYVAPNYQQQPIVMTPNPALKQAAHAMVMGKTPEERKRLIGENLYSCVALCQPRLAGKITGMLLEMSDMDPLVLTYDSEALMNKINEAVAVLKDYQYNYYKQSI